MGAHPQVEYCEHPREDGVWDEVLGPLDSSGYPGQRWGRGSQASPSQKCRELVPPGRCLAQGQDLSPLLLRMLGLQQRGDRAPGLPREITQEF